MGDLWTERGRDQRWLSGVTLTGFFGAGRWNAFQRGRNPGDQEGMCSKPRFLFLVTAALPSLLLLPSTHTHKHFLLPHSSVIRKCKKRNLVFAETARLLLHHEQSQGCGEEADRRTSSLVSTPEPEEREQIRSVLLM